MSSQKFTRVCLLALFVMGCAQKQPEQDHQTYCQTIQSGIQQANGELKKLREITDSFPQNSYSPEFLEKLDDYTTLNYKILKNVDNVFAQNEQLCKTYFVLHNQVQSATDFVYEPYLQIHIDILEEEKYFLQKLQSFEDTTQLKELIQTTQKSIEKTQAILKKQDAICKADFAPTQCKSFTQLINTALKTTASENVPTGEPFNNNIE